MLTGIKKKDLQRRVSALNIQVTFAMAELSELKRRYPELAVGFRADSVGSIVNAYREGDLSFQSVVMRLDVNPHNLARLEKDKQDKNAT